MNDIIQSLVYAMEIGRPCIDGYLTGAVDEANGDRLFFDTFSSCGIYKEGMPLKAWFFDQQAAIDSFLAHFRMCEKGRERECIHWRSKPVLNKSQIEYVDETLDPILKSRLVKIDVYNVRARFLLSDKHILPQEGKHNG